MSSKQNKKPDYYEKKLEDAINQAKKINTKSTKKEINEPYYKYKTYQNRRFSQKERRPSVIPTEVRANRLAPATGHHYLDAEIIDKNYPSPTPQLSKKELRAIREQDKAAQNIFNSKKSKKKGGKTSKKKIKVLSRTPRRFLRIKERCKEQRRLTRRENNQIKTRTRGGARPPRPGRGVEAAAEARTPPKKLKIVPSSAQKLRMKLDKTEKELEICNSQLRRETKRVFAKVHKQIPKAVRVRRIERSDERRRQKENKRQKDLTPEQRKEEEEQKERDAELNAAINADLKRNRERGPGGREALGTRLTSFGGP